MSKRITGYLNYKKNRSKAMTGDLLAAMLFDLKAQSPDHIALTGDLVHIALDQEMINAARWLEMVGRPDHVSLVPGNHDAYLPGALERAIDLWHPYFTGDEPAKDVFPYLRSRGPVCLVGLSTAIATAPFMATGKIGEGQLERAKTVLSAIPTSQFRVVLIHHPPFVEKKRHHKRLLDIDAFKDMIAECGAELILHGHTHRRNIMHIDGPNGPVPVVGVPSASSRLTGHHEPSRFNLFDIGRTESGWSCSHIERGLNDTGTFQELDQRLLDIPVRRRVFE